jgi:molybdate transport system substrate-binding protein
MVKLRRAAILMAVLAFLPAAASPAAAAELKILSPGATEGALTELIPQFEASSGHKATIAYGPVGVLADRIKKGEAADVAILSEPAAAALRKQGKLVAGSETVVAKVGIGVFVRKGDPKPDISSADAFRSALERAKAIAYADPALGGSTSILIGELMKSLDDTGAIAAKTKLVPPARPLLDLVAGGAVDFGFDPVSEVLLDPRVELVGPLPAPIQRYTRYVAALIADSRQEAGFKALIAFLSSPAAGTVLRAKGFEPL